MILVDTSVWIDHLHSTEPRLQEFLVADVVATHDGIIEELALGSIRGREEVIGRLEALRRAPRLTHDELLTFVERNDLWGRGLSVIDVHLLGSARLSWAVVWSRDKRLLAAARFLDIVTIVDPAA
ncbi:PIN domain-containing protein [Microbacteriaceae bacterium VKM Ac-2854]|nr:PIN domain-containing protein [Microbacteriaceae bacterium VKM Ac-2854]